jgi:hypothetical protein
VLQKPGRKAPTQAGGCMAPHGCRLLRPLGEALREAAAMASASRFPTDTPLRRTTVREGHSCRVKQFRYGWGTVAPRQPSLAGREHLPPASGGASIHVLPIPAVPPANMPTRRKAHGVCRDLCLHALVRQAGLDNERAQDGRQVWQLEIGDRRVAAGQAQTSRTNLPSRCDATDAAYRRAMYTTLVLYSCAHKRLGALALGL